MSTLSQHFVTFLSPGTFFSESTEKPIAKWDAKLACRMARKIKERYNATPYGFYFTTRSRKAKELDSKVTKKSGVFYLGGKVETLAEIERRNSPDESILRSNMRCNKWDKVITNTNSWRITLPLEKDDVVLEWKN